MKLFINGRFLSQPVTGVQRAALETVRALDRLASATEPGLAGVEVQLLAPASAKSDGGLRSIPVRKVGVSAGHVWEQIELPWHARGGALVSLANAAPVTRGRQCVTIHDASVFAIPSAYSSAYRTWYRALLPVLGRLAGRIVTDSEYSRSELTRYAAIPQAKIRVVPLGAEHILAVPCDVSILNRHRLGQRPFVLAVGSNSPHKNLRALGEVARQLGSVDYDVVVAGGENTRVFDATAPDWPPHVRQLGYVTDAQLRALYSHASVFVFPSFYEGFGLPPLEAMACGCPVVAANSSSVPEVCGDAAIYCDPGNPADFSRAIERVMGDEALRRDLASRGQERARGFTWERSAKLLLEVLRETWH